jgi:Predicted hydrolases or acyltransferases (alpha/beta hydrolase superfamily)
MEKVKFENRRGGELVGNYWSTSSDTGIVMSHGFTGSKEQFGKFTEVGEKLHSAGFNVLAFDFSGCGESEDDSITLEKEVEDLNSAIEFLQQKGVEKLGLFGLSQGGWITLETYKERKKEISCLVLLAPLTDALPDYRQRKYSEVQRKALQEDGYTTIRKDKDNRRKYKIPEKLIHKKETLNQDELLEGIDCPVLFIHGTKDDSVPIEQSKKAVDELNSAELTKIEDNHYWEESVSEVAENSIRWFKQNLG